MSTLTAAAALVVASVCQPKGLPSIDPNMLVRVAQKESGLQTDAINENKNGTRDYGLMQINDKNFEWLGVTARGLLDERPVVVRGHSVPRGACVSMEAAVKVLMGWSVYNSGHPTRSLSYAMQVTVGGSPRDFPSAARPTAQSTDARQDTIQDIYDEPGDE